MAIRRILRTLLLAALSAAAASHPVLAGRTASALESRFTAVGATLEEERQAALEATRLGLSQIPPEAVLLTANLPERLPSLDLSELGELDLHGGFWLRLNELKFTGADRQTLLLTCSVVLRFQPLGLKVAGEIDAAAVIAVKPTAGGIEIRFTPVGTAWRSKPGTGVTFTPEALAGALDVASTEIGKRIEKIVLPAQLGSEAQDLIVPGPNGSSFPFRVPAFEVKGVAVLLDQETLRVMVGLAKQDSPVAPIAAPRTAGPLTFENVRAEFQSKAESIFGLQPGSSELPAVHLSRALLAPLAEGLPSPVTAQDRVKESIGANLQALASLAPRVAGLDLPDDRLQLEFNKVLDAAEGAVAMATGGRLEDPRVTLGEQALGFSAGLRELKIAEGIEAGGHFRGVVTPLPANGAIQLALAFDHIEVETVTLSGWKVDPVQIVLGLSLTQANLLPVVNGLIPPVDIALPMIPAQEVNPLPEIGGRASVRLDPARLTLPSLAFGNLAVLIAPEGVRALVEVQSSAWTTSLPRPAAMAAATSFAGYRTLFDQKWRDSFGGAPPASHGGALTLPKSLVADFVNGAWPSQGLSAQVDFDEVTPLEPQDHRIGHIDTNFDCRRTRECRRESCTRGSCNRGPCHRRSCTRAPGECDFNCLGCINLPFGGRICSDDPICLARKAACNADVEARIARCNIEAEAEVAACNLREETQVAACNASEEAALANCNIREELKVFDCNRLAEQEVAACNLKREAAQGLANLGEIGSTRGEIRAAGSGSVQLRDLKVAADLASVTVAGTARAAATLQADVEFVPKGGLGTIVGCVAPIRFRPVVAATMASPFSPVVKIADAVSANNQAVLRIAVPEIRAAGQVIPTPVEALFASNPEMRVVCPIVSTVAELLPLLGQGITVLTGDQVAETAPDAGDVEQALNEGRNFLLQYGAGIAYVKLDPMSFEVPLPSLELDLPSGKAFLEPSFGATSVSYALPVAAPAQP